MSNPFQSKQQLAIIAYVTSAKALPICDKDVPGAIIWPDPTWNVTSFVKRVREHLRETVAFHHARQRTPTADDLMAEPFGDVAKAFLAYQIDANSRKQGKAKTINLWNNDARVLRVLDGVLRERGLPGQVDRLTREMMSLAVDRAPKEGKKKAAITLRQFARDLEDAGIAVDLKAWTHPALTKNGPSSRVNEQKRRSSITEADVSCLARAYRGAEQPKDRFAMSIVAILMCAPGRKEEALILPALVEIVENPAGDVDEDEDGTLFHLRRAYKCGLRWWPVKNGPPQVKFVPKEMMPLAVEALNTIREITQEAREVAGWLEDNPGKVRLPDTLSHVRRDGVITHQELQLIVSNARDWLKQRRIGAVGRTETSFKSPGIYAWAEVEQAMLACLPPGWPVLSKVSGVKYRDALCISLLKQFNGRHAVQSWMVEPIGRRDIDEVLVGRPATIREDGSVREGMASIFERLDIRLPDGTFPSITTHQLRHYLNTIAQRARVPQAHVAHWSGRKNVMQNPNYDHTDKLVEVESIKSGGQVESLPEIQVVDDSDQVDLSYLAGDRKMSLHSTAYGYCHRRFAQEPCDRAGACRTCTRLVCLGGSERAADLLKREAARDERSLANLRERQTQGRTVNPRVVDAVEHSVARSRALAEAIMDPVNGGHIIRNTDVGPLIEFSHAQRIIDAKREEIAAGRPQAALS